MLNIIYDATQLVDGESNNTLRRGIYFVSLNILKGFLKRTDVNVCLWSSPSNCFLLNELKKRNFPNATFYYEKNLLVQFISEKLTKLRSFAYEMEKHFFIRKILWSIMFFGNYLVNHLFSLRVSFSSQAKGAFFSPQDAIPWCFRKQKNLLRFIVLYDAIPFKLPDYSLQKEKGWFANLVRNINPSDYYFAISEETRKDFCHFFSFLKAEQIRVTYLAAAESFKPVKDARSLDYIKEKYKLPGEKKYIFSLCTLEPRKNLIRAVKSFISFVEKNNIQDLVWVMGGGQYKNFSEQLKSESLYSEIYDQYIVYAGYVDDDDLPALYSNAEWFVFTSQYEGFGLPPLEAMQCGCPVITSNNSSLPEVVGDAGLMIDWDSNVQHVEAYEKYYFNKELRAKKKREGLERAKLFSWNMTLDKMVTFMKNVSTWQSPFSTDKAI
ncbi:MAG: glycosyltransferase family 4 protein [Fibrobacter sp.]|nr:glycosyltransferase family 4 protein [Fibrobacter sp.]